LEALIPILPPGFAVVIFSFNVATRNTTSPSKLLTLGLNPTKKALLTLLNVLLANCGLFIKLFGETDSALPLINAVPTTSKLAFGSVALETNPLS
jgi:hypothetical protein